MKNIYKMVIVLSILIAGVAIVNADVSGKSGSIGGETGGHYNQTIAKMNIAAAGSINTSSSLLTPNVIDYDKIPLYVYISGLGLDQYCKGVGCDYPNAGDYVIQLTVTDVHNKPWKNVPITVGLYACGDSDYTGCGETYQNGKTDRNGQIRLAWEFDIDSISYFDTVSFDIYATSPKSGRQVYVFKNIGGGTTTKGLNPPK